MMTHDADLLTSPAFAKNADPILDALRRLPLPERGWVLEIGSGPGQHVHHFARAMGDRFVWQPTERDEACIEAIRARGDRATHDQVRAPLGVDLLDPAWPEVIGRAWPDRAPALIMSVNVAHITSWQGVTSLIEGAGELLEEGGVLYFYGPFRDEERALEPSNARFDEAIRARYPGGGLRLVQEVAAVAHGAGMELGADWPMPAHNRSLWFTRRGDAGRDEGRAE